MAFDGVSGIVSFEAEAFTPEDAKAVTANILGSRVGLNQRAVPTSTPGHDLLFRVRGAACRAAAAAMLLKALRNFRDRQNAMDLAQAPPG